MKVFKINFILFCFAIAGSLLAEQAPLRTNVEVVDPNQASATILQNMVLPTFEEGVAPSAETIRSSLPTNIVGGENGRNAIIRVDARAETCLCYTTINPRRYTNDITTYEEVYTQIYPPLPPSVIPREGYVEVIIEGYLNSDTPATAGVYSGTGALMIEMDGSCCR